MRLITSCLLPGCLAVLTKTSETSCRCLLLFIESTGPSHPYPWERKAGVFCHHQPQTKKRALCQDGRSLPGARTGWAPLWPLAAALDVDVFVFPQPWDRGGPCVPIQEPCRHLLQLSRAVPINKCPFPSRPGDYLACFVQKRKEKQTSNQLGQVMAVHSQV